MKYHDLCGLETPDVDRPWLDRTLTPEQTMWRNNGVVVLPRFMPDALVARYRSVRDLIQEPGGWKHPTPYMEHDEIKDICLYEPLMRVMHGLIGEPMGLHLNLTGYVSTERKWHQDSYLNPAHVNNHYAAVWLALDDIHPDSGPFQYVPGSHQWPQMTRDALFAAAPKDLLDPHRWPSLTQDLVGEACEDYIKRQGVPVETYVPSKGDVLIWNGRTMHRGSKPNVPGMPRLALISHYSSIRHRPEMPAPVRYQNGQSSGFYFPINTLDTQATVK